LIFGQPGLLHGNEEVNKILESLAPPSNKDGAINKVNRLVLDSDRAYRGGSFDSALRDINEAAELFPDDPGILLRRARLFESMQRPEEAAADYAHVAGIPGLTAEVRTQADQKCTELRVKRQETPPANSEQPTLTEIPSHTTPDARDEFGLQRGSTLGIVDATLREGDPGTKALRIAIKARPGISVDTRQMKLHVFFYEQVESGEVQLTESKVVSQWITPPVNWGDNEPEILDVSYSISPESPLVGYLIGTYYNKELQDSRADPPSLARSFPLPLYLAQESAPALPTKSKQPINTTPKKHNTGGSLHERTRGLDNL
jgi:hypothetical protein